MKIFILFFIFIHIFYFLFIVGFFLKYIIIMLNVNAIDICRILYFKGLIRCELFKIDRSNYRICLSNRHTHSH